jgi:hypothetical protein
MIRNDRSLRYAFTDGGTNALCICKKYGVSRKTYYKWKARYENNGINGLRDLSRVPRTINYKVDTATEETILGLRLKRFGCNRIRFRLKRLGEKKQRRCSASRLIVVIEDSIRCIYKGIWSQQMGRTRLETPVLCYDHIPDWLVDLLPVHCCTIKYIVITPRKMSWMLCTRVTIYGGAPVIMTVRWILSGGLDLRNINFQAPFRICQGYPPLV